MTEMKKEEKEKESSYYLYMHGYIGFMCMVFALVAVCVHYGWMVPREGSNLSSDEVIYATALACGLFTSLIHSRMMGTYGNIHPFVRKTIVLFDWALFIILLGAFLDLVKRDDVDWVEVGLIILAAAVIFGAWAYMLKRKDRYGETYGDRIERTSEEKAKKLRIKRYDEREVMESRSAMGLPNPGQAEIAWDNRHTYIDVKKHTIEFIVMLAFLCVIATVGKHLDSYDGAAWAFVFAFLAGVLMLRTFIYEPLHCAVLHGAMRYEEGAKYGLLMMGGYSVFCNILSCVMFEGSEPVWDIWGYVTFLAGTFIMFFLAYLLVTIGNKHNGHEFAFFDTDGYAKGLKDPREEEKDEEKDEEKE